MIFNEMLRYSDFMTMAAHTMGTSTLDISATASVLNTLGLTFKVYGDRFVGSIPVAVTGNSPQPAPTYPIGGDQPKLNSGSPTYPLDMFAALSGDRKLLILSVVNPTESAQQFSPQIAGVKLRGPGKLWQIAPPSLTSANQAGQKPVVEIVESAQSALGSTVQVPPVSISVYEFEIA